MELLTNLGDGFAVAFSPMNLIYVTLGVLIGTVIGLLPGLGATAAIAILLPLTFSLDPATAIIMLAGIYYGSMYGGRVPSILLRLPGDASSVITTLDGYPLARQGKAGVALGITAIGSFIGGTIAIIGLTFLAPLLAQYAARVGAPELFALTLFGIIMIGFVGSGSRLKSMSLAGLGLLVAAIGTDPMAGTPRLTFGSVDLSAGIDIVPVAVGLFGLGEIFYTMEKRSATTGHAQPIRRILPNRAEWLLTRWAILRASVLGFFVGILPGGGGAISSVLAYGVEKRISKRPEKFGKGALEGLAATETADNASSNSAFIPLLTLGVPPNAVMALLFGALLMQNVTPGPQLINTHPEVFFGVIASMYIGNALLLLLNLPLIRVFVLILKIPTSILSPIIVIVAFLGVYAVNSSMFDVVVCIVFGIIGYLLKKLQFDMAPFILAFVLGPIMEVEFRRTMTLSDGSLTIFFERPVALAILLTVSLFVVLSLAASIRRPGRGMPPALAVPSPVDAESPAQDAGGPEGSGTAAESSAPSPEQDASTDEHASPHQDPTQRSDE